MISTLCKNCCRETIDYPSNKRVTCSKECHYKVIGEKLSIAKKGVKRPDMKNPYWLRKEGSEHPMFTEAPSYNAIHNYVRRRIHKPESCNKCGEVKPLELANISGQYSRDTSDWTYLCKSCHRRYDRNNKCIKGHELSSDNIYIHKGGSRTCKRCRANYSKAYKAKFKQRYTSDPIKYLGQHLDG